MCVKSTCNTRTFLWWLAWLLVPFALGSKCGEGKGKAELIAYERLKDDCTNGTKREELYCIKALRVEERRDNNGNCEYYAVPTSVYGAVLHKFPCSFFSYQISDPKDIRASLDDRHRVLDQNKLCPWLKDPSCQEGKCADWEPFCNSTQPVSELYLKVVGSCANQLLQWKVEEPRAVPVALIVALVVGTIGALFLTVMAVFCCLRWCQSDGRKPPEVQGISMTPMPMYGTPYPSAQGPPVGGYPVQMSPYQTGQSPHLVQTAQQGLIQGAPMGAYSVVQPQRPLNPVFVSEGRYPTATYRPDGVITGWGQPPAASGNSYPLRLGTPAGTGQLTPQASQQAASPRRSSGGGLGFQSIPVFPLGF